MAQFGPMGSGLDTDMESGDPVALDLLTRQAQGDERKNRRIEKHLALVEDLAGGGGTLARQIAEKLARRIDDLITNDPEASAYRTLLQDVQHELRVGARIARDEVEELFTQDG